MEPMLLFLLMLMMRSGGVESRPSTISRLLRQQKQAPKIPSPYKAHYFPQIIDHFNFGPKSSKLFLQKYLMNQDYWHKGAPIFVYTGNSGDIGWFAENTGFLLDIAPKFHALVVFIEHRYYGESMPFGNQSYNSLEALGFMNTGQALADFANLITSLKHNLSSETSPVVVFGGSYGGMLAAWFRLKYPHIAIGALASSAPILMFDHVSTGFADAVSQDYKDASLNCYNVMKGSWEELESFSTKKHTMLQLTKTFKSCRLVKSTYSVSSWLSTAFVYTSMVNYPTKANFEKPLPAYPVQEMCKIIDEYPPGASKLTRAFAAASLYYNYSGTQKCFDLENDQSDIQGIRGWDWQSCTEMVMPMSNSNQSMFPPSSYNYTAFVEHCENRYGVTPRPHQITTEYGGIGIEKVLKRSGSNIIFSNGMQDPWSRGSVLKNISASIVALVTERGAHHVDFRHETKDDPEWLVMQRKQEVEIIQKWVDEYYLDYKQ
uniref:lysosomal Pro-X carboxypeptidase n=1 Tax=Erigeron canadensis TaxID=72917 RepID=UPI001CB8F6F8|nr:lysosomal Pro-X carboxypeptidase [Erigeron canadensis]